MKLDLEKSQNTDIVEQRVVRQFVEALLFERIASYERTIRSETDFGADIFESIYDLVLDFELSGTPFRCIATCRSFSRVRIAQGSVQYFDDGQFHEARLANVLYALDISATAKERMLKELVQTMVLCRWNIQNLSHHLKPRRTLSFPELESAIIEGHLYHPSFKARTGFSLEDHQQFGPENRRYFQLHWLAVKRGQLNSHLPIAENIFWQRELSERVFNILTERLLKTGANWSTFALLPIHPWQFNSIQSRGLAQVIALGDIVELGVAGDFYQATQSLRTLVNVSNPLKANIKVPLNLVSTSAYRNFQEHFVCTAPVISNWLQQTVINDNYLKSKLLLLSEYAALLYRPTNAELAVNMAGLMGAIFRESVLDKLIKGEMAIPFTAIMLVESDGRPFIAEWLETYGIEIWIDRLLDVVLMPIWHLLVHHGIALEAHAQNLVLIHRDGWPEKIVLRDFHESMEFVQKFLPNPDNTPALEVIDSYFANIPLDEGFSMGSVDALRELFMDTVYVFNLSDLSFLIERFFGYFESKFWQRVHKALQDYRELGVTDPARIDQIGFDKAEIAVESLLKKKIMDGGVSDHYEHNVVNVLHAPFLTPAI